MNGRFENDLVELTKAATRPLSPHRTFSHSSHPGAGGNRNNRGSSRFLARLYSWFQGCCCCCCSCCPRRDSVLAVIVFGQFVSFLTAAAGAAQGTLELDCHLSAPSLSVTPFYVCLAFGLIPLYCMQQNLAKERICNSAKKTDSDDDEGRKEFRDEKDSETPVTCVTGASAGAVEEEKMDVTKFLETEDEEEEDFEGGKTDSWRSMRSEAPVAPKHTFLGLIPISHPAYVYLIVALADFYANYFTVMAFRYTTITSVALTDAFAIPSAMALSCCWFGKKYSSAHYLGISVCMIGIALNVYQDSQKDDDGKTTDHNRLLANVTEEYPHKTLGDALGLFGGILFGVSNTIAEYLVRDNNTSATIANMEYLSLLGFFASIICLLQVSLLEADRVNHFMYFMGSDKADDICPGGKAFGLWMGFSLSCLLLYIGTARFLQVSEAVFLNLSLLTGDFWSVGFSVIAEHIAPLPLFYPSLAFIIGGTIFYEMSGEPAATESQAHPQLYDTNQTGTSIDEGTVSQQESDERSSSCDVDAETSAVWA